MSAARRKLVGRENFAATLFVGCLCVVVVCSGVLWCYFVGVVCGGALRWRAVVTVVMGKTPCASPLHLRRKVTG